MTDERLPWFPCEPSKLLGALTAMKPHVGYTYWIVCLRIYEIGGPCPDTLDAIARRTGYNKRVVSEALDVLFRADKLVRTPDGIMNPYAATVLDGMKVKRGRLSQAGGEGAARRWRKTKGNQTNGNGAAMPSPMASDADLQLQLDSPPPNGGGTPAPKRAAPKTRLPKDFELTVADIEYAAARGFRGQTVRTMLEAFKNHHEAKGTVWAEWHAAWRTWVGNEVNFSAGRGGARRPNQGPSLVDIALGRNPNDE